MTTFLIKLKDLYPSKTWSPEEILLEKSKGFFVKHGMCIPDVEPDGRIRSHYKIPVTRSIQEEIDKIGSIDFGFLRHNGGLSASYNGGEEISIVSDFNVKQGSFGCV